MKIAGVRLEGKMADDLLASALARAARRDLPVVELFRVAELLKCDHGASAAEALYAVWSQHNDGDPLLYTVLFNYAVILTESDRLQSARDLLARVLSLNSEFIPAYINLGRIEERLGGSGRALAEWSRALARMADVSGATVTYKTTALNQMARTLQAAHQDEHAADLLRQSLELDHTQREVAQHLVAIRQRQCDWPVIVPSERVSRPTLMAGMSPLSAAIYADDPILQMAVAWNYNRLDVGDPAEPPDRLPPEAGVAGGKLRVGYLSSDLREHSVGHLMAEVFGLHDRSRVEVFAYYCGIPASGGLHDAFKASADHWRCISDVDDATAAGWIAADGIQILVDLNGYTREARTRLIARRPAPVIVNWLGYPGTTASPYHHYIIADDWIIPEDHALYYTETVLRLPCYQPSNRSRTVAADLLSRAEAGLPEAATVFCCFNGPQKITRAWFARWMDILDQVPGSVLWLLSGTPASDARLRHAASACGIDPSRIVFAARMANADHLARYLLADLCLDTFPYGAHTTGSDALWMGVPVLTRSGRSFAARVCSSLVRAAGLPELVCETAEAFVALAVRLGRDRAGLRDLRERLGATRDTCTLFDMPNLVRSLEALYLRMWRDACQGTLPQPDLANLDVYLEVASGFDGEACDLDTVADYRGWWRERLQRRHAVRPITPDRRLLPPGPPSFPGQPASAEMRAIGGHLPPRPARRNGRAVMLGRPGLSSPDDDAARPSAI